jgi:NAD(P)-dependent dehydrogenase (short-subunit alcohol dehydrogenase family)
MFDYQPSPDLLKDRIILVTGAGDGIGRAAAMAYAEHGATVIILGRTQHKLESLYDDIVGHHWPEPIIHPFDLLKANEENIYQLTAALAQTCGRLDGILHNAALLGSLTPLQQYKLELWDQVMQVNVKVPLMLSRACIPLLQLTNDSAIVFTSTDPREKTTAYWGAYGVSKAAQDSLMTIMADELETNTTIRVHAINPGPSRTRMRAVAYPGENPNTVTEPANLVAAYLYLMGPDARSLHGQCLDAQQA